MRKIDKIIIHCADTYKRMDIGKKEITEWHKARGFNDVGYHYIIRRDGTIEQGRELKTIGAHAKGYNSTSIAICYVGGKGDNNQPEDNRTTKQKEAMQDLVTALKKEFPDAEVVGHGNLPGVKKACPCFNVKSEFKN